ncbi:hypothetical protein K439DRAFT_1653593 [Ramaria rubella]|nr:hypothetical protein K439DRAFT_1653593 [Ramaria rubella]
MSTHPSIVPSASSVDLLILGAGWTSNFLIPLLKERKINYASTSRSGHGDTLKFVFDPNSPDNQPFQVLPNAGTVLITFPIYGLGGSKHLLEHYHETHPNAEAHFIQLGSTGIYDGSPTLQADAKKDVIWSDRHSPYNNSNSRAIAEDELLSLNPSHTTVLELCGLWGGERSMRNWVGQVAPSKEVLKSKKSIHMIHGFDVARSILAVHEQFSTAAGSRWIVTDGRVYDWWDLASAWGDGGEGSRDKIPTGLQPQWVRELMEEENIRALPRSPEQLGRALDSREFWSKFRLSPAKARLERDCA